MEIRRPGFFRHLVPATRPHGKSFAAGTKPTLLLTPDQAWESGTVEAPDLVSQRRARLPLLLGQRLEQRQLRSRRRRLHRASRPLHRQLANPILASGDGVEGPGGESVFTDASGDFFIAFHAWVPGAVGFPNSRELYIRHFSFSGSMPSVAAPVS